MGRKLIALGNQMMKDDSIAIRVAQNLAVYLETQNIQLIIGETDTDYCLAQIEEQDELIILDAAYGEAPPGSIHVLPLEDIDLCACQCFTQHEPNLLKWLIYYKKPVKGIYIGIEVEEVAFGLELSNTLEELLSTICEEVKACIQINVRGNINA